MTKRNQRQREWAMSVADFKASGLKMADWCSANDVKLEQLKYWTRKFKKLSSSASQTSSHHRFVPLTAIESSQTLPLLLASGQARIALQ